MDINNNHCSGILCLTLSLLTTNIVAPPSNASKWQMGFNSAFKGLKPNTAQIEEKVADICKLYCQYMILSCFTTYFFGKV